MEYPKPQILDLKAIKERVPVYQGHLRLSRDLTVSPAIRSSLVELRASLEYQACDDSICYPPAKVPFTFSLEVEPLDRQRAPEALRRKSP